MSKPCEKCVKNARPGERFCGKHRASLIAEMLRVGYLRRTKRLNSIASRARAQ